MWEPETCSRRRRILPRFDAAGNLLTSTDARAKVGTYTYDALNRLLKITWTGGETVTYTYDTGTYGIGHLAKMVDPAGTTRQQKGGSRLYKRQKKLVFCPTTERLEVFATMRVDFLMCVIGSDARGLLTQYSRFRDSKHDTMLLEVEPGCPSHLDDNAVSWQEHDGTEVR